MKMIRFDSLKDVQYYKDLALQRYNMPASRMRYLMGENRLLEELDQGFVTLLIKYFAQPNLFSADELKSCSLVTILEYLRKTHILYIYKRLPEIAQSIHILMSGCQNPEPLLGALDIFFKQYSKHLIEHIDDEDVRLFRYVKNLIEMKGGKLDHIEFQPKILSSFSDSHSDLETDLLDVRKLLRAFMPTKENQTPYRILLDRLRNFELDLHIHARVEDEVLLPRAIELERELMGV